MRRVRSTPSTSERCTSARWMTAYGLPKRRRNASPTGRFATSDSSTASIIVMRSTYTARDRACSPTPSASNAANAFGPSCTPAPISPIVARLLEHRDVEAAPGQRERRGQAADATAGDEHAAVPNGRHADRPETTQVLEQTSGSRTREAHRHGPRRLSVSASRCRYNEGSFDPRRATSRPGAAP